MNILGCPIESEKNIVWCFPTPKIYSCDPILLPFVSRLGSQKMYSYGLMAA